VNSFTAAARPVKETQSRHQIILQHTSSLLAESGKVVRAEQAEAVDVGRPSQIAAKQEHAPASRGESAPVVSRPVRRVTAKQELAPASRVEAVDVGRPSQIARSRSTLLRRGSSLPRSRHVPSVACPQSRSWRLPRGSRPWTWVVRVRSPRGRSTLLPRGSSLPRSRHVPSVACPQSRSWLPPRGSRPWT